MLWRQAGSTGHRAPFHTTNPAEGSGAAPLRTVILSGYLYNMNQSEGLILKLTRTSEYYLTAASPALEVLTFPARGGSIFSDQNCAQTSRYFPKVRY